MTTTAPEKTQQPAATPATPGPAGPTSPPPQQAWKSPALGLARGKQAPAPEPEPEDDGLVKAAFEVVRTASDEELSIAFEAMARAGVFGEASREKAVGNAKRGASVKGSASGGAGVSAEMEALAKIDRTKLIPALELVFKAGARVGLWGEVSGAAEAHYGKVSLAVKAKVEALVGAEAKLEGAIKLSHEGLLAKVAASAFAGAKVEGEGEVALAVGPVEIAITGEAKASAGAEAEFAAKFQVSLHGVKAKFAAEAHAGAKASAKGGVEIRAMGKKIISAAGEVEVSVGAGAKVKGEFEIAHGKLKLSAGLAGALGIGVGADVDVEVDLGALADVIVAQVLEARHPEHNLALDEASPAFARVPLTDPAAIKAKQKIGYEAVYAEFLAYAQKKALQGDHGIKREQVQAIIVTCSPLIKADLAYLETDQGIEQAARDAFGEQLVDIMVQAGRLRAFQAMPPAKVKAFKEQMQKEERWRKERDSLTDDFNAYCTKKASKGKNGIKQGNVQDIVKKHWKSLSATFGAEADEVVMFAAEGMRAQYLDDFAVVNGKITTFVVSAGKTTAAKQGATDAAAEALRTASLADLHGKLVAYRGQVLRDPKGELAQAKVQGVITAATKPMRSQLSDKAASNQVRSQVLTSLGDVLDDITLDSKGQIAVFKPNSGGMTAARSALKADQEKQKQDAAVAGFGAAVAGYLEKKTKQGESGLKSVRIQELLDKARRGVETWSTTDEASRAFEAAAEEALTPVKGSIGVSDGQVRSVSVTAATMTAAKKDRRENGKATLGGADDDNSRRHLAVRSVKPLLAAYAAEVRAAGAKDPGSAKAKVSKQKVQDIIDKGTKKVRADVRNAVGDEALTTLALDTLTPMVTAIDIVDLTVKKIDVDASIMALTKAKRDQSAAVQTMQRDLAAEVKASANPSRYELQKLLDKHRPKLSGLDPDEADQLLAGAIATGLGARFDHLEIEDGKITSYAYKPLTGKAP